MGGNQPRVQKIFISKCFMWCASVPLLDISYLASALSQMGVYVVAMSFCNCGNLNPQWVGAGVCCMRGEIDSYSIIFFDGALIRSDRWSPEVPLS